MCTLFGGHCKREQQRQPDRGLEALLAKQEELQQRPRLQHQQHGLEPLQQQQLQWPSNKSSL